MEKHEKKYCPKCGQPFTCKVGDVANCQCSMVSLTPEASAFLAGNYDDCLCQSCLRQINEDMRTGIEFKKGKID